MRKLITKFVKFALVGGVGACIQLGLTYLLTQRFHLYYMLSLVVAIGITTIWNFTCNLKWTFKEKK
jgi:dolichol-phosphate mannosyltransferase